MSAGQELQVELDHTSAKMADGDKTRWRRLLWVTIAAGTMIRLLALLFAARMPLASDSTDYREMALLLLGGKPFVPYWPPGLSLYLAPFLAAGFGDVVLRASMLGWWWLFCFGFVRLAVVLRVRRSVWMSLLAIFSVMPAFVHFSIEPMTQMPSAALLLLAVSAAVRLSESAGWGEVLLLGASLGGLSLVRPSAIPLLLALPALVLLRRRHLLQPLAALALGAVMIFTWMAKVHQFTGRWVINNSNGANLYYGNNPWTPVYRTWYFGSHAKLDTDEIRQLPEYEQVIERVFSLPLVDRSAAFTRLAIEHMGQRPGLFLLRTVNRIRCFWGFDTFTAANIRATSRAGRLLFPVVLLADAACYLTISGFAFIWIAAAPASLWHRWQTWLLSAAIVLYALPYWATMSHPTYHFPVMAPLALLGAMAWELSRSTGTVARVRGWAAVAVLGLIQVEWLFYLSKS